MNTKLIAMILLSIAVTATAGAAGEIITDGQNGYLVAPGNPYDLADRIHKLQSDRRLLLR